MLMRLAFAGASLAYALGAMPLAAQQTNPAPSGARPAAARPAAPVPQTPNSRQQVPLPPRLRGAPFQLSQEQQQYLWAVLKAWERESGKVQTLRCKLVLWEYDTVFNKKTVREGELNYKAPDHGLYRMQDASGRNWVEHWMCDGAAIYQYNYAEKKVIQRNVPPELRGKAISDGPLPFLFGADANKLIARYYMRVVTPENAQQKQVWIEAYPKKQADAANFQRATVILNRKDLIPFAIELYMPNGKTRSVHQFESPVVNEKWTLELLKGDPFAPYVPRGWTKIVDPELTQGPPRGPQRIAPPMQARTPGAAPRR